MVNVGAKIGAGAMPLSTKMQYSSHFLICVQTVAASGGYFKAQSQM